MPQTPHVERHFTASEAVRDIVIGMSDGLTVPFALAAGLSGAVEASAIIITAGLAEVAAGAIAMGLGGYLAARTDAEHYASERAREERETQDMPETEAAEVADVLRSYGLEDDKVAAVVNSIRADKRRWVDFMMRFELGLEEPDPRRASRSALTIALSYIAGGLVPLSPYFFLRSRGGAVAMNIDGGEARLVLLCPAWKKWGTARTVKPGTVILHSRADDVVPFADSEELVRNSGLPASALVEVGTDHRLADPEPLAEMLRACEATDTRRG